MSDKDRFYVYLAGDARMARCGNKLISSRGELVKVINIEPAYGSEVILNGVAYADCAVIEMGRWPTGNVHRTDVAGSRYMERMTAQNIADIWIASPGTKRRTDDPHTGCSERTAPRKTLHRLMRRLPAVIGHPDASYPYGTMATRRQGLVDRLEPLIWKPGRGRGGSGAKMSVNDAGRTMKEPLIRLSPTRVAEQLGGEEEFEQLMMATQSLGVSVKLPTPGDPRVRISGDLFSWPWRDQRSLGYLATRHESFKVKDTGDGGINILSAVIQPDRTIYRFCLEGVPKDGILTDQFIALYP